MLEVHLSYDHGCTYCSHPDNECDFPNCVSVADRIQAARFLVRRAAELDKEASIIAAQQLDLDKCKNL